MELTQAFFTQVHLNYLTYHQVYEDDSIVINRRPLINLCDTGNGLTGLSEFMKILTTLLSEFPNLKVLIGGRDRSAYGPPCFSHNGSWKEMMLDKLPMLKKHPKIIYTGLMNYENYRLMLQRTNLHCYYPSICNELSHLKQLLAGLGNNQSIRSYKQNNPY